MFIENKYTKWYYSIINKALNLNRPNSNKRWKLRKKGIEIPEYYEDHHIIPKSLGGTNSTTNEVVLTAKEHYICHILLTKMVSGLERQKMCYALWNLLIVNGNKENKQDRNLKINSSLYKKTREECSQFAIGKKHSEETKKKISEGQLKVLHLTTHFGENNGEFKGYFHTPWGKFSTAREASKNSPYNLRHIRISRACKSNDTKIMVRKPIEIPQEWVGKTHAELGFWFEPVER